MSSINIKILKEIIIMKAKMLVFGIAFFLILPIFFMGCSSGGSGSGGDSDQDDSASTQVLPASTQVLPSQHDFGIVTLGNSTVPLEVKIKNNRSKDLVVSEIVLSDTDNFDLDLGGGSNPCNASSPTIGASDLCTMEISFQPLSVASYGATLRIVTNDENFPVLNVQLGGASESVKNLNVRINQVESDLNCPAAQVTAYVSVTDQGGYAVTGLLKDDFLVYEDVDVMNLTDFSFVSQVTAPISVALVMDYSGSITDIPEAQSDMEEAVADFVDQLGADDEAEIVKFATEIVVVQGFTSDKSDLTDAIFNPVDVGRDTILYDAAWQAVDDTALRLKTRKAVIIVSDGEDGNGNPISSNSLSEVINHANDKGVPIFTVGLGIINDAVLEQMSNETGGQFFDSPTSDNLRNIYSQIAKVLFENQYILTYVSALGAGVTANLTIEGYVSPAVMGDVTKEITPCP